MDGSSATLTGASASGGPAARRTGGGPRLALAEWAALIAIHHAHAGNPAALAVALGHASECLTIIAAGTGFARSGTRLRSPAGLRRRLTVVRTLEAGGSNGLPTEARAAWALFASQPEEAARLAREALSRAKVQQASGAVAPSRGPAPGFGPVVSVRADGENRVYVMRLAGPAASLLYGGSTSRVTVKVGRSAAPMRRQDELNWGLPPGCGLEWQLERDRTFLSAAAAHVFEQALLARLLRDGLTIGGEYARVPVEEVAELLEGDPDLAP